MDREMHKGKINDYDPNRGYGSIIDSGTGLKLTVYANHTDLKKGEILTEGQDVEYEIEYQRSENWAIRVRIL
jgi:cold shock CspA family protein